MPNQIVQQGDCMASIGKQLGYDWQILWNHPRNAGLKRQRRDPNVLFAGDSVYIPNRDTSPEQGATNQRHSFKLKGQPCKLRLRLLLNDKPRANAKYVLTIDGKTINGQTDGNGWLEQAIPPDAKEGKLALPDSNDEYPLRLGHLDPIETISGVKGRLRSLGFYKGPVDSDMNTTACQALAAFQKGQKLKQTGQIDQPTKDALKAAYGS